MQGKQDKEGDPRHRQRSQHLLQSSRIESVFLWLIVFIVLLAPYYRGLYFRFERLPFFLITCGIGIAMAIFWIRLRKPFLLPLRLTIPFVLFVILYGCNIPFSADHGLAYQEFTNWAMYCLLFLLVASLKPRPLKVIFLLFGANTVVLAVLSLLQGFGRLPEGLYLFTMSLRAMFIGGRIYSTFQYPNTASAYFGMGYLALLGALLDEEKEWLRGLTVSLAFLAFSGNFFTYSRGGILALGITILVLLLALPHVLRVKLFFGVLATVLPFFILLPFLERSLRTLQPLPFFGMLFAGSIASLALQGLFAPLELRVQRWPARKFLFTLTLFLSAVICLFVFAIRFGLAGGEAARLLEVGLRSRNVWERLVFYRDGLQIFLQRPLTGWGGGGWEALYLSFRSFPYISKTTHNLYLQLLVEGGIIGLFLFGSLLFFLFRELPGAFRKSTGAQTGFLFGILFLSFLHGFVDFNFSLGAYQLAVWFFAGCASWSFQEKENPRVKVTFPAHPIVFVVAFSLLFAFTSLSYTAEWRQALSEYLLQNEDEESLDEAIQALEQAVRLEPWNPAGYYALSKALRKKVNYRPLRAIHARAIAMGEKALDLSPWNSLILEHVGVLHAEVEEFELAVPFLKQAIKANPLRLNSYLNLARVCAFAGRYFLGRGEKEKALLFLQEGIRLEKALQEAEQRSIEPPKWDTTEIQNLIREMRRLAEQLGS